MSVMKRPLLQTMRLNLFKVELEPRSCNKVRHVWLGFRRDVDVPWLAVSLTVWPQTPPASSYCEYIETSQAMRGRGLAREAWKAVARHYDGLTGLARTDAGRAFAKRLGIKRPVFEELKP